jgi:hypothetical protein
MGRISKAFGIPDAAFGARDTVEGTWQTIDIDLRNKPTICADWEALPFAENTFTFGYWDPPYDHLYKTEGKEIWRVCRKMAVLHTHVYPTSWFHHANRVAHIGVSMGPLKQMRAVQVFEKTVGDTLI